MRFNQVSKMAFALLLFCLFSFSVFAQSETTERVKNRAENRTNQRVDQKIDQGVDRALNKIEGLFRKKKNTTPENNSSTETSQEVEKEDEMSEEEEEQASDFLSKLRIGGEFEAYENPVRMNLTMDFTTVDKRGKTQKMDIAYTFDTWRTAMIMNSEDSEVRMLLDNKEGYQTIISTDKGETQAFRMRQQSVDWSDFVPDESEFTITETGNTRTIDGYSCKEYIIAHEDGTTNSWVTQDISLDMKAISQALASQGRNKKMPTQNYFNLSGFPIESTTVSQNGKETMTTHFRDIKIGDDINLDAFDTTGIKVMSMGF